MQLFPILILAILSQIYRVCASTTTTTTGGDGFPSRQETVIQALLEKSDRTSSSPDSVSVASNLSRSMQNGRITSDSSIKRRGTSSSKRSVLPSDGRCNPQASLTKAWKRRGEAVFYGGETAYLVPQDVYNQRVVIKKILINIGADKISTDKIVAYQQVAMMNHVGQLVAWGVAKKGEQEIWLVVQAFLGLPADKVLRIEKVKPIDLKSIQNYIDAYYEDRYRVRLPRIQDVEKRYTFWKEKWVGNKWHGAIVGWKGGECVDAPKLQAEPKTISPNCLLGHQNDGKNCDSDVVVAWQRKTKNISYGGEAAWFVPHTIRLVIKEIRIKSEADKIVARQQIAILELVGQFKAWGIVHQGDQEIWLVVQKYLGVSEKAAMASDQRLNNNTFNDIRLRTIKYASRGFKVRLQDNAQLYMQRFRYQKLNTGQWVGVIVGWKGGESISAPRLRVTPDTICFDDL